MYEGDLTLSGNFQYKSQSSALGSSVCTSTALLPNASKPWCWKCIWTVHRCPCKEINVKSSISFMGIQYTNSKESCHICCTFSGPWLISVRIELPPHFWIPTWNKKKLAQQTFKAKCTESQSSAFCAVNKFFQRNSCPVSIFVNHSYFKMLNFFPLNLAFKWLDCARCWVTNCCCFVWKLEAFILCGNTRF